MGGGRSDETPYPSYRLRSTRGCMEAGEGRTPLCTSLSRFRGAPVLAENKETRRKGKEREGVSAQAPPPEAEEARWKGKDWPGNLQNLPKFPAPPMWLHKTHLFKPRWQV